MRRTAIAALQDAAVRRLLDQQGAVPCGNSGNEFDALMRREREKWAEVTCCNNITAD